jgi:hypothetical protein
MAKQVGHFGLIVGQHPYKGHVLYAEIVPAPPLLFWVGFSRKGWRRFVPFATGRTWKEPHIRWWYEIHSTNYSYEYQAGGSGGATTLGGCISRADDAINGLEDMFMRDVDALSVGRKIIDGVGALMGKDK